MADAVRSVDGKVYAIVLSLLAVFITVVGAARSWDDSTNSELATLRRELSNTFTSRAVAVDTEMQAVRREVTAALDALRATVERDDERFHADVKREDERLWELARTNATAIAELRFQAAGLVEMRQEIKDVRAAQNEQTIALRLLTDQISRLIGPDGRGPSPIPHSSGGYPSP